MTLLMAAACIISMQAQTIEDLRDEADSLYNAQQYDAAKEVAIRALPQAAGGGNSEVRGDLLNLLSMIGVRQGDFESAARYAKQCNELDLESGDIGNIASSYNTLAGIYMSMRQPREAEKYILKAIDYARQADNPQRMAVLLGMASEVYHHLEAYEQSLDYATQAYNIEQQLGRTDKMAVRQAQRASALISLKRDAEASRALDEAIPGLRKSGNRHSLGIACNQMGLLLHQQGNDSAAVRYFNEALQIFLDQRDLFNESHSRKGLYEALRRSDPAQAMEHNDRYLQLRDSIYDKNTGELLSKYAAEYGYGELQAEHGRLLSTHHLYIIIGVAVLAVLLVYIAFSIRTGRRDRRRLLDLIDQVREMKESQTATGASSVVSEATSAATESADNSDAAPAPADGSEEDLTPAVPLPREEAEEDSEENRLFMLRLINVVNESLPTGQYGVESIASQLNMSSQTFRRRLAALTGETPKAFIFAIQMELAAKLLTTAPELTVAEIAARCGYDELSSFSRTFRRAYGMTPSQYREQVHV